MSRVLFVSSHAELGGSERYLVDLVTHLPKETVVRVVCLAHGPLVGQLETAGIRVEVIESSAGLVSMVRSARVLRRSIRSTGVDVVHANGIKAALVCALAWFRQPIVWAKHDFSWDGPLARLVAGRCTAIVGVSRAVLDGMPERRARVVMPGLAPVTPDRAAGRASLEQLVEPVSSVVVLVGRIHPVKGHRELIEAGPAIRERVEDARFLFAGGADPHSTAYAQEMADLAAARLGDAAVWTGYRADLPDLLSACAVAVVLTGSDDRAPRGEGFGYVALEAMAVGTAVVAYDRGAIGEVLGGCGLVVQPGDRGSLVSSIEWILRNDVERQHLAECGYERVREHFTMERFVSEMEQVYEAVAR